MIDIAQEQVVSLTEACPFVPRRRKGKRPDVATLYRWAQKGIRGIRLEILQVGRTKCTSLEALQRFFERLTDPNVEPAASTPKARAKQAAAEQELAEAGI